MSKRHQSDTRPDSDSSSSSSDEKAPPPKKKSRPPVAGGFWRQGLLASMNDPKSKVFEDDRVVVIKDKYPKARFHFLVMPKENINGLHQLKSEHSELLEHMKEAGQNVAKKHADLNQFRLGFHARASMSHLHLHVISQDFDSESMKTKKHWNSFTTEFFREFDSVLEELKENGKIAPPNSHNCDAMMKRPLKCHKCKGEKIFQTMPKLKEHLKSHLKKG